MGGGERWWRRRLQFFLELEQWSGVRVMCSVELADSG